MDITKIMINGIMIKQFRLNYRSSQSFVFWFSLQKTNHENARIYNLAFRFVWCGSRSLIFKEKYREQRPTDNT
jgi:hypothetical protein